MQTTQGNMLLSLENAKRFTIENAAALGSVVAAGALSTLGASIAEMSEHATVQYGQTRATKSAIVRRRELRTALIRDYMTPIARIASLELAGTPELVALELRKGYPNFEQLVGDARGMADAAEPHAQVFINAGMSPDFTAAMRTAADLLVQSLTDKSDSKSKVRTATSALKTKLKHGRKAVKVIDAMIKSALAGNKDLLEGWKLAKRVPQTRGSAAAKTATPATPSAPTSAAA